ncbi:MAG: N-acetyltransferase [Planctomycetota bacterium]
MNLRNHTEDDTLDVAKLFESVFADSEGEAEGLVIGRLAKDLFEKTDDRDLFNFVADLNRDLVGSIFFSRLWFKSREQVFILGPVAVHTDHHRKGIGQALIRHGLSALREEGVDFVLTYGDPNFYGKVGFRSVSHETVIAPYPLSQPVGWLGQSLVDKSIETLTGSCTCVEAFKEPAYW